MVAERHPQQREIDWQRMIDEALTVPGNLSGVYSRFYPYSYANQLLLRLQGVNEPVATRSRWQELGRQVIKDSTPKEIIRPIFAKRTRTDGEEEQIVTGFKPVRCIFTLSETEGKEVPPMTLPEWDMATALEKLRIRRVPFASLNGNAQGYSIGRDIAVNPIAVNPTKTLVHEIGHVILGHTLPQLLSGYATHRGIGEFQAEATAYLTLNELQQLDERTATVSRGYVQNWLQGERPPDKAIRQVFGATDQILRAGRLAVSPP